MMIRAAAGQQGVADSIYRTGQQTGEDQIQEQDEKKMQGSQEPFSAVPGRSVSSSGNDTNKIKASVPDDNVAQLASELANCQTKFDVQQVSSKAMRALANLRMSGALSEGTDKEKIAQMIRRMQKLIKRVRIKMKGLTKEEELEKRRKRAEEEQKEREAREIKDELRNRRDKRQRDERDYAMKEAARGGQEAMAESVLPGMDRGMPSLPSGVGASVPAVAGAVVSIAVDAGAAPAVESVSLDVTV